MTRFARYAWLMIVIADVGLLACNTVPGGISVIGHNDGCE